MFNLRGTERLAEWKRFRDELETSQKPLEELAKFWSKAPFVNRYLDPNDPSKWPDPWHLVLDDRLDYLAIALGMLYTLKLTHRFMDSKCEIHTAQAGKETCFILLVDNEHVLNLDWAEVVPRTKLEGYRISLLYSGNAL